METLELCNNCVILQTKLSNAKDWNKFYHQKLQNKEKFLHIAVDYEREKQRNVELQLAYDQRTRDSTYVREQMTSLLLEFEPMKDKLGKAENELQEATKQREQAENALVGLQFSYEQLQHELKELKMRLDSRLVETLERKHGNARTEIRRLKLVIANKQCEIDELRRFQDDRRLLFERLNKRSFWALRLAKTLAAHISEDILQEKGLEDSMNRMDTLLTVVDNICHNNYLEFCKSEKKKLKKENIHLAAMIPCLGEWLDDFDKGNADEASFSDMEGSKQINKSSSEEGEMLEKLIEGGDQSFESEAPVHSLEQSHEKQDCHSLKNDVKAQMTPMAFSSPILPHSLPKNTSEMDDSYLSEGPHTQNSREITSDITGNSSKVGPPKSLFDIDDEMPLASTHGGRCENSEKKDRGIPLPPSNDERYENSESENRRIPLPFTHGGRYADIKNEDKIIPLPSTHGGRYEKSNDKDRGIPLPSTHFGRYENSNNENRGTSSGFKHSKAQDVGASRKVSKMEKSRKPKVEPSPQKDLAQEMKDFVLRKSLSCFTGTVKKKNSKCSPYKVKPVAVEETVDDYDVINAILKDMRPHDKLESLDSSFSLSEPESLKQGIEKAERQSVFGKADPLVDGKSRNTARRPRILLSQSSEGFPVNFENDSNFSADLGITTPKEALDELSPKENGPHHLPKIFAKSTNSSQGFSLDIDKIGDPVNNLKEKAYKRKFGEVSESDVIAATTLTKRNKTPKLGNLKEQKQAFVESWDSSEDVVKFKWEIDYSNKTKSEQNNSRLESSRQDLGRTGVESYHSNQVEMEDLFGDISDSDDEKEPTECASKSSKSHVNEFDNSGQVKSCEQEKDSSFGNKSITSSEIIEEKVPGSSREEGLGTKLCIEEDPFNNQSLPKVFMTNSSICIKFSDKVLEKISKPTNSPTAEVAKEGKAETYKEKTGNSIIEKANLHMIHQESPLKDSSQEPEISEEGDEIISEASHPSLHKEKHKKDRRNWRKTSWKTNQVKENDKEHITLKIEELKSQYKQIMKSNSKSIIEGTITRNTEDIPQSVPNPKDEKAANEKNTVPHSDRNYVSEDVDDIIGYISDSDEEVLSCEKANAVGSTKVQVNKHLGKGNDTDEHGNRDDRTLECEQALQTEHCRLVDNENMEPLVLNTVKDSCTVLKLKTPQGLKNVNDDGQPKTERVISSSKVSAKIALSKSDSPFTRTRSRSGNLQKPPSKEEKATDEKNADPKSDIENSATNKEVDDIIGYISDSDEEMTPCENVNTVAITEDQMNNHLVNGKDTDEHGISNDQTLEMEQCPPVCKKDSETLLVNSVRDACNVLKSETPKDLKNVRDGGQPKRENGISISKDSCNAPPSESDYPFIRTRSRSANQNNKPVAKNERRTRSHSANMGNDIKPRTRSRSAGQVKQLIMDRPRTRSYSVNQENELSNKVKSQTKSCSAIQDKKVDAKVEPPYNDDIHERLETSVSSMELQCDEEIQERSETSTSSLRHQSKGIQERSEISDDSLKPQLAKEIQERSEMSDDSLKPQCAKEIQERSEMSDDSLKPRIRTRSSTRIASRLGAEEIEKYDKIIALRLGNKVNLKENLSVIPNIPSSSKESAKNISAGKSQNSEFSLTDQSDTNIIDFSNSCRRRSQSWRILAAEQRRKEFQLEMEERFKGHKKDETSRTISSTPESKEKELEVQNPSREREQAKEVMSSLEDSFSKSDVDKGELGNHTNKEFSKEQSLETEKCNKETVVPLFWGIDPQVVREPKTQVFKKPRIKIIKKSAITRCPSAKTPTPLVHVLECRKWKKTVRNVKKTVSSSSARLIIKGAEHQECSNESSVSSDLSHYSGEEMSQELEIGVVGCIQKDIKEEKLALDGAGSKFKDVHLQTFSKRQKNFDRNSKNSILFGTESSEYDEELLEKGKKPSKKSKKGKIDQRKPRITRQLKRKLMEYSSEMESEDENILKNRKLVDNHSAKHLSDSDSEHTVSGDNSRVHLKRSGRVISSESESDVESDSEISPGGKGVRPKRQVYVTSDSDDEQEKKFRTDAKEELKSVPSKSLLENRANFSKPFRSSIKNTTKSGCQHVEKEAKAGNTCKRFKSQLVKRAARLHKKAYFPLPSLPQYQHIKKEGTVSDCNSGISEVKSIQKHKETSLTLPSSFKTSKEKEIGHDVNVVKDASEIARRLSMNMKTQNKDKRTAILLDNAPRFMSKNRKSISENNLGLKKDVSENFSSHSTTKKELESSVCPKSDDSETQTLVNISRSDVVKRKTSYISEDTENSDEEGNMEICEEVNSDVCKEENEIETDKQSNTTTKVSHPGLVGSLAQLDSLRQPRASLRPKAAKKIKKKVPASSNFIDKLFSKTGPNVKSEECEKAGLVENNVTSVNKVTEVSSVRGTGVPSSVVPSDRPNDAVPQCYGFADASPYPDSGAPVLNFYGSNKQMSRSSSTGISSDISSKQISSEERENVSIFRGEGTMESTYPQFDNAISTSEAPNDAFSADNFLKRVPATYPKSRIREGEERQKIDSELGAVLDSIVYTRLNSQYWHKAVNDLCAFRMFGEDLNAVTRTFIKKILLVDPFEKRDHMTRGLPPSLYKLFQSMSVLERRLALPVSYIRKSLMRSIHMLVTTRFPMKSGCLANLMSWFSASAILPDEKGNVELDWLRSFLMDILYYHRGSVHHAILAALETSKRLMIRTHGDRLPTCLEKLIDWIVFHGEWNGINRVRAILLEWFHKHKRDPPKKNPLDFVKAMLKDFSGCSDEGNCHNIIVSIVVFSHWQGSSWTKKKLLPIVRPLATEDSTKADSLQRKYKMLMEFLMLELVESAASPSHAAPVSQSSNEPVNAEGDSLNDDKSED